MIGYPHRPLEWQEDFHESEFKYKLMIGGIRAGKTFAMVLEVVKQALEYPGNEIFIGRYDLDELRDSVLRDLLTVMPDEYIRKHRITQRQIELTNGTIIKYSYLDKSKKADRKILGRSYGLIVIDQVEEIDKDLFDALDGRLSNPIGTRQFLMTANPNGKDWVWDYFVNPESKMHKDESHYWLCKTTDNLVNLPSDYYTNIIKGKPEIWINRYVEGKFDELGGTVYSEFDKDHHTFIQDFDYSKYPVYVGIDPGYDHPTGVLWMALVAGQFYIFDELYLRKHTIEQVTLKIHEKNGQWGIEPKAYLTDPHAVQEHQAAKGLSTYKELRNFGIPASLSQAETWTSIMRIKALFGNDKVFVHTRCENFLNEIGRYTWKAPGSLNQLGENYREKPKNKLNDLMDAMKYVLGEPDILDMIDFQDTFGPKAKEVNKNYEYYTVEELIQMGKYEEESKNYGMEIDWQHFL